jgi:hypothetical protein
MEYYCSLKDKKYKLLEDHDVAVSSDTPHVVRMFLLKSTTILDYKLMWLDVAISSDIHHVVRMFLLKSTTILHHKLN